MNIFLKYIYIYIYIVTYEMKNIYNKFILFNNLKIMFISKNIILK